MQTHGRKSFGEDGGVRLPNENIPGKFSSYSLSPSVICIHILHLLPASARELEAGHLNCTAELEGVGEGRENVVEVGEEEQAKPTIYEIVPQVLTEGYGAG